MRLAEAGLNHEVGAAALFRIGQLAGEDGLQPANEGISFEAIIEQRLGTAD